LHRCFFMKKIPAALRSKGVFKLNIAIDGPAGAGKSTLAWLLSRRLKLNYLDTGAMYRAITLKILRQNINLSDEKVLLDLLNNTDLQIVDEKEGNRVIMDGEEVTSLIRDAEVNKWVSQVSSLKLVREAMVKTQRKIAHEWGGVVMDGRDIGTCVLPDANYKFYLDASLDERIKRRYQELLEKGKDISLSEVKEEMSNRDKIDQGRLVSPLRVASGAIVVDTTDLNQEEVLQVLMKHLEKDPG